MTEEDIETMKYMILDYFQYQTITQDKKLFLVTMMKAAQGLLQSELEAEILPYLLQDVITTQQV